MLENPCALGQSVDRVASLAAEKRLVSGLPVAPGKTPGKPRAAARCRSRVVPTPTAMTRNSVTVLAAACVLLAGLLSVGARAAGDPELKAARKELRLRVETERRMRGEFESLLADGRISAAEIIDFEDYLVGLGLTVEAQRRVVANLQETGSQSAAGALRNSPGAAPLPADFDRGQTDEEKIALLDAQLGNSLSEFDEKLLREQKELAEKSRSASTGESGGNQEGSDGASGNAGDGQGENAEGNAGAESGDGAGESTAGSTGQDGESAQQAEAGEQGEASGEGAAGDDRIASAGGASGAGRQAGKRATPPDIPDGKDDDIVARQLREAAESEQDPELREKLWEEYRKYKKRTP